MKEVSYVEWKNSAVNICVSVYVERAMLEAAKMALHLNCRVFYGKVEIVYMLVHTKLIKTASQAKGGRVVVFNSIFSYSYLITAT